MEILVARMTDASPKSVQPSSAEAVEKPEDPPVVARMVVEIRSDGTRTIARGAIEDVSSGERAAIEAKGTTPMALAASLTKSLLTIPALGVSQLAKSAVKALVKGQLPRPK